MPWTLWRAILIETVRLVLIATAVLVTVIAFAATIKPLADGKLNAAQAITFMLFAVPPMLSYALPFAAGFGATLAYHRFASENELTAMYAGGVAHRTVLVPALAVGAALAGMLAVLNEQVIPRFLKQMETLVTQDLADVMINSMAQGEAARLDGIEIYADSVVPRDPGLYEKAYLLSGVGFVQLDDTGEVEVFGTAKRAWVLVAQAEVLPESARAQLQGASRALAVHPEGAFAVMPQGWGLLDSWNFKAFPLPSAFDDDPKFLTWGELRALRAEPERMNFINNRRMSLARALAAGETMRVVRQRFRQTGAATFQYRGEGSIRIAASDLRMREDAWFLEPPPGSDRIEVEVRFPDGGQDTYLAEHGSLRPSGGSDDPDPAVARIEAGVVFYLDLETVEVKGRRGDEQPQIELRNLTARGDTLRELRDLSSAELLTRADQMIDRSPVIADGPIGTISDGLKGSLGRLGREITSKQHERVAFSIACLVMVLTGAVMALKLKEALPLVVYLWSFFPALGTVLVISGGQSVIYRQGAIGIPLIWSGVLGLAVYTFLTYRALSRH